MEAARYHAVNERLEKLKHMKTIRQIEAHETLIVRHPVLRPGKDISTCHFDGDDAPENRHFGLYQDLQLVGVVTLFKESSACFQPENQFRIRGMAVLHEYQKKGYGEALVRHVESVVATSGNAIIWFNARIIAVGFYEKLGYEKIGNLFDIGDIGAHYVMFKNI